MISYKEFDENLFEDLNDVDLFNIILEEYEDDDLLSEDDTSFIMEYLDSNEFENEEFIAEKTYLKKALGGGRRIRKKDTRKLKSLQSDGKGGVKKLSAGKRHKLKKQAKKAWRKGGRRSASAKKRVAKKTKKTQRKRGGTIS